MTLSELFNADEMDAEEREFIELAAHVLAKRKKQQVVKESKKEKR